MAVSTNSGRGVLFGGVLMIRALLFEVYMRAPDSWPLLSLVVLNRVEVV